MMLQKTYSAYSNDLSNQHLFIELGYNHLACWCKKDGEKKFSAFEFFQCDAYDASVFDSFINQAKLYSKLLLLDVIDTTVLWSTIENLCIPAAFSDDDFLQNNFCLINGSFNKGKLYSVKYEDVLLVTRVDMYLNNEAQKVFPNAAFSSGFTLNKPADANSLMLYFYPHCFFCSIYKDEKLLFAKSKLYTDAADVLYFILDMLHQYKLENNIEIIAGGFIDERSKLFETLYQYLEGFKLGSADEALFTSSEFQDLPAHYFLPYINYLL